MNSSLPSTLPPDWTRVNARRLDGKAYERGGFETTVFRIRHMQPKSDGLKEGKRHKTLLQPQYLDVVFDLFELRVTSDNGTVGLLGKTGRKAIGV